MSAGTTEWLVGSVFTDELQELFLGGFNSAFLRWLGAAKARAGRWERDMLAPAARGCPAVLRLVAAAELTTRLRRCVRTAAASQKTKRASRAATSLPLLGCASRAPTGLPAPSLTH